MTQTTTSEWWTVQEVAAHFRVSARTILRRIRSKMLPAIVELGHPRIHQSVIRMVEIHGLPKATPTAELTRRRRKWEQVPDVVGDRLAALARAQQRRAAAG